jgi:asparagine synthase (glutamine-hydrolysing)
MYGDTAVCGIAGVFSAELPIEAEIIGTMTHILRHRGPDDEGYIALNTQEEARRPYILTGAESKVTADFPLQQFLGKANLYLGHRRLAIVDLSPAGHQPMHYGDHLWLIFNGEIYNYIELGQELKAAGYVFNTETDSEVILAAYDRWGEECVTRFNGDWAFCILDLRQHILFLSRDRYGIKPLYFAKIEKYFAFASEIKAIVSLPFVPRSLNHEMAFHYLGLFCRTHTDETLFEGVYQLLPGQNMRVDIRTGGIQRWQYYTLSYCMELGAYNHNKALSYAQDIRDLLFDAVRLRLRADVPVGTCLSGGLDSSAIVAIMAKLLGAELNALVQNTFTASYPGEPIDEGHFARSVIKNTGAVGHFVYPTREEFFHTLATILYHQDEPFGGTSVYAQWKVMQEASHHVKVVLDGQGGDEVFAGYRDYHLSFLANLFTVKHIHQFIAEIWYTARQGKSIRQAVAEVNALPIFMVGSSWKLRMYRARYRQEIAQAQWAFSPDGMVGLEHIDRLYSSNVNELLFHYMTTYSLPHLLRGEDRNSMAHSIEARVPFTDYRLVDYVFSLPGIYKIRHGWTKWLLRLAVADLLPPTIVWRTDKLGFATPLWASKQDEWNIWMQQTFQEDVLLSEMSR